MARRTARIERVRALVGGGADVVIEAAGSARAFEEGLEIVRDGGTYVIAGHYTNVGDSTINAHRHINRKHLDIRGLLGQRGRALPARARNARTLRRRDTVGAHRRPRLRSVRSERRPRRGRGVPHPEGTGEPMDLNRRTRILATLGPSSDAPETIEALLEAGADAFRLNFSHGTHDEHAERCRRIRDAAARVGREVAIVQDLGGPKIRVGPMSSPVTLAEGSRLVDRARSVRRRAPAASRARSTRCSPRCATAIGC